MTFVPKWLALGAAGIVTATGGVLMLSKEAPAQPPTIYFGTVAVNGALGPNRNGITSSSNIGGAATPGEYLVIFNNPVNTCALSATMASASSGEVTVQGAGPPNRVNVNTYNSTGSPADRALYIVAYC
jgi:hypothetical protein